MDEGLQSVRSSKRCNDERDSYRCAAKASRHVDLNRRTFGEFLEDDGAEVVLGFLRNGDTPALDKFAP